MKTLITIKDATIAYGTSEAVSKVSCVIQEGDFIGLIGPNGGGKSTLAKAILRLVPLKSGFITFDDSTVTIGYLPQKHANINPLVPARVQEVVAFGLMAGKVWPKILNRQDKERIDHVLSTLGISSLIDTPIAELSGGQQQKVLLARAIVAKPHILLLDEPSTALDPESREQFFKLIHSLHSKENTTIILITHDTGYIGKYATKILYIDKDVKYFGTLADYCPEDEVTSRFEKTHDHIIWHQHS